MKKKLALLLVLVLVLLGSVASAAVMAITTYFLYRSFVALMPQTIATILTIAISSIVYFAVALLIRTEPIMNLMNKLFHKKHPVGE